MHCAGTRASRAEQNPLRSIPLLKAAVHVLGPTPLQAAQFRWNVAQRSVQALEAALPDTYAAHGRANALKAPYARLRYKREAFQRINRTSAQLRAARKALAAVAAELLALDASGGPRMTGARFMPMIGDSMVPTVGPGDLVAVMPTSEFRGDGLYVIDVAGGPNVVRVQSLGNGLLGIKYDHPAYSGRAMLAVDLPDALLGKVFAVCNVVCPRTAAAAGMAVAPQPIAIQGGAP